MPPKSATQQHYSLSQLNSVKFWKDFTQDRFFFTQTLFAHLYVFASLLKMLKICCNTQKHTVRSNLLNLVANYSKSLCQPRKNLIVFFSTAEKISIEMIRHQPPNQLFPMLSKKNCHPTKAIMFATLAKSWFIFDCKILKIRSKNMFLFLLNQHYFFKIIYYKTSGSFIIARL